MQDKAISRVLVFTRTKHGANKVVQRLEAGRIHAEAIHGNKSQTAREAALKNFKSGRTRVLVATDIAARGLDVDEISHIINYDLPNEPETYVHRIGRTARAGASGDAFSFCDVEERAFLRDIERLIKLHIPVATEHSFRSSIPAPEPTDLNRRGGPRAQAPRPQNGDRQQQGQGRQQGQRSRNGQGRNEQRPQNGERRNNPRPQQAQGERPQNGNSRPQAAQPHRDNRSQGERRSDAPRDNSRSQGDRPKFGNGSFNPQGVHPRVENGQSQSSRPQGERATNGERRSDPDRDNRQGGSRPYGQRPQGQPSTNGERRSDARPQYNSPRPQRDNQPQSDAPTIPTTPVRRKRPLPPPDQREQPVLTDRFGNPLPIKPKPVTTPSEE